MDIERAEANETIVERIKEAEKREAKEKKRMAKLQKRETKRAQKIDRLEKRAAGKAEKIAELKVRIDKADVKITKLRNSASIPAEGAEPGKTALKKKKRIAKLEMLTAKTNSKLAGLKMQLSRLNEKIEYMKSEKKVKNVFTARFFNTRNICFIGLLTAIIVAMSFTPLGYLQIGIVKVTFLMVPVAVGSIVLGPLSGAFLGFIFAITSFAQCFGFDFFGTTLFAINPGYCFILCFVPRILAGLIPGYIFKLLYKYDKSKAKITGYAVAALAASLFNTIFFMGGLMLFYGQTEYIQSFGTGFWSILWALGLLNGIIEAPVCCLLGGAISKVIDAFVYKRGKGSRKAIAAEAVNKNNAGDE